jgi:hypothetical protein
MSAYLRFSIIVLMLSLLQKSLRAEDIDYSKPFPLEALEYPISDAPYVPPVILDVDNIQINSDYTTQVQNEESVCINPTNTANAVAIWRDFRLGYRQVGFGYTFDNGQTWDDALLVVPIRPWVSDPVLTVDDDGNYFACTLGYEGTFDEPSGIYVQKSTDSGMTWSEPVIAIDSVEGVFEDKEWITLDRTAGPTNGNIYISWTRFFYTQVLLVASYDGGQSFSDPVVVSDDEGVQWSVPTVGLSGELFVAWFQYYPTQGILMDVSFDQGMTFGDDEVITETYATSGLINGGITVFPFPALASDVYPLSPFAGNLYLAFMDENVTDMDIFFMRSEDNGVTWSEALRINDDAVHNGADQFHPWISVDDGGVIHAVFYDRRLDENNWLFDLYYTKSENGGETWSPNERITTVSSNPGDARLAGLIGEYIGLSAWGGGVQMVWTDTRNGNQDVFSARLSSTGACCSPGGDCQAMTEEDCIASDGQWLGAGTECLGDGNENGIDDACEIQEIPTLSEWGMIFLALLLMAAGTTAVVRTKYAAPVRLPEWPSRK